MQQLRSREEVDAALEEARAVIYKHSTRCVVSAMARAEMARFQELHPEVPLYRVDVLTAREVSRYVEARTGVEHHSPQAILLVHGKVEWHASHSGVTARALARQLRLLESPG
jgi:bacillithiol system protein YtxJ